MTRTGGFGCGSPHRARAPCRLQRRDGSGPWASSWLLVGFVLIILGLAAGALILLLVFGGISANSAEISAKLSQSLNKIQAWLNDLGIDTALTSAAVHIANEL